jgi:predicted MPP superfamily phosphohydrolase
VLTAGVLGAPVVMQIAGASVGMSQLDHFRVREIVVRLPQLPVDFEGFVIAHVTDTHVGRFTSGATLTAIAEAVNSLKADCVVHTGDLINDSLEDLPAAKAMLAKFRSVHGTFLVEGNHDLFESRTRFVQGLQTQEMWDAGLRVLLNNGATIERGSGKLQLLGMRWGNAKTEDIRTDRAAGAMLNEHAAEIDRVRDARAFSVLLAHHPHAFDRAIARAIPLTLAGHTHGGQINVLPSVGPATMSYRYISGLYERVSASGERVACIVGNGTGNWFPLRVQAPAEIVRVVLRRS